MPQMLARPPPPQVCGGVHVPQSMVSPQPSAAGPQLKPRAAQVFGVQIAWPHRPAVPPQPQVSGGVHEPHWMTLPQPSPVGPHVSPC